MADDYTHDLLTTGAVTVGGSVQGTIETAGDEDWSAVELEAGVEYRIDLKGSDTGGGTLWYVGQLHRKLGTSRQADLVRLVLSLAEFPGARR